MPWLRIGAHRINTGRVEYVLVGEATVNIFFAGSKAIDKLVLRDEEMSDFMHWMDGESFDPGRLTAS